MKLNTHRINERKMLNLLGEVWRHEKSPTEAFNEMEPQGEPPLTELPDVKFDWGIFDVMSSEKCKENANKLKAWGEAIAQAQRTSDIKFYEGDNSPTKG